MNDDFTRASLDLQSIVRAERLRVARQLLRQSDLVNRLKD
jgi:hypothetical protein